MERRPATLSLSGYKLEQLKITSNPVPCYVLGMGQYAERGGDAEVVMICELLDGRVIEVGPTVVTFDAAE